MLSNSAANITVNSVGQFVVSGPLNFDTVPQLCSRGYQLIAASPIPIFDLQTVTSSDNAGPALLISWMRYARKLNKQVKFSNIPEQLLAIAKVSSLHDVISMQALKKIKVTTNG